MLVHKSPKALKRISKRFTIITEEISRYCKLGEFEIWRLGEIMSENMNMLTEDMPRERMRKFGVSALSNCELLSIILSTGTRKKSVISLSNEILVKSGGLGGLMDFGISELKNIEGIGEVKAGKLLAIAEIAKRLNSVSSEQKILLNKPDRVFHFIKEKYMGEKRECVYCISLDSKNQMIHTDLISIGTVNFSVAHPREIFQSAIKNSAVSIILVHNHPSGDLQPSVEDINLTRKVEQSGNIIGIKLADHIIVSRTNYYSLKENQYF